MHSWRRRPAEPEAPRRVTALEYYGAKMLPDLSGWWVYALGARTDGHIFRAGQSESLLRRLDDYQREYPDLYDPRQVYLIPVADQHQADLREAELIDFYQPEKNTAGRRSELERRLRGSVRGGFHPGHKYSLKPGELAARRSLDSKQATN
jgi:hypothetical protein